MAKAFLTVAIFFDEGITDAESLATAADILLETALSTPGILSEYGDPEFGEFFVQVPSSRKQWPSRRC
jgi:hypothetical protein